MRQFFIILLLVLSGFRMQAQSFKNPLSPDAEKVWKAYKLLIVNKLSVYQQLMFLNAFPDTKDKFIFVFDPDDKKQLYDMSHDYIESFREAGQVLPDSVLKIGLNICKGMKWSSGVSDEFQHAVLSVAADHPEIFVDRIYMLKRKEIDAIVTYLSDVEAQPECAIYQKLITRLHDVGAYNLEGMLQRAKTISH